MFLVLSNKQRKNGKKWVRKIKKIEMLFWESLKCPKKKKNRGYQI
jgi:hypothetical protein